MNDNIDIIVPWVDNSDSEWIKARNETYKKCHPDKNSNSDTRFQSWDNMQYWFRAIEKFMPWVHKIFFVTCGHIPKFLNTDNPRLEIVNHSDYIPKEYLPTFNSNTIEMNYHRIQNLSENFVIFNDDSFPLQPIAEEYYFKNNIVCDEAVEGHITPKKQAPVSSMGNYADCNNIMFINRYFNKREVQEKNWEKWYCDDYGELLERTKSLQYWYDFSGFRNPHMASAMKKSTLKYLWEIEGNTLHEASKNHFRAYNDVTQYLVRYWQLCEGNFLPRRTLGKFYWADKNSYLDICSTIENQKQQMISINEICDGEEFEMIKKRINQSFSKLLPAKSTFEK